MPWGVQGWPLSRQPNVLAPVWVAGGSCDAGSGSFFWHWLRPSRAASRAAVGGSGSWQQRLGKKERSGKPHCRGRHPAVNVSRGPWSEQTEISVNQTLKIFIKPHFWTENNVLKALGHKHCRLERTS